MRICSTKGYYISPKDFWNIFKELDVDKDLKISYTDFRTCLLEQSEEKEYLIESVRLEMKHKGVTLKQLFDKKTGYKRELNIQDFLNVAKSLHLDVDIVNLEFIFGMLDTNDDGVLDEQELKTLLDEAEKKNLSLNTLRKEIFKRVSEDGIDFQEFFESVDYRGVGVLNYREFEDVLDMLSLTNFDEKAKETLFQRLDRDRDYMISFNEFSRAYNERDVHLLFGYIQDFKNEISRILNVEKLDLPTLVRKYDRDCDGYLNSREYETMVDKLNIPSLKNKEDRDFLFSTIDRNKNGKLGLEELSIFMIGESIVDVIEIIEQVRRIIR